MNRWGHERRMRYDVIICFETHVELATESKLFCSCRVSSGAEPNTQVCPVCTGQPGTLPLLNKRAVEYCIRAGLALNCSINASSRFARKNYFYPDLPKGYQISQYELPFCENGHLEILGDDGMPYPVGIKRIHLEEDAGKLVHAAGSMAASSYSLVDYNRAGVPLLEIVGDHTRNPIRSLNEARAYLEKLRQVLRYIGISECSIEQGQFRCDVNVSLRPKGSEQWGNRAEIKNMASLRFIVEALQFEIKRQSQILESGGTVVQETRAFDEAKKITLSMRSKEDAPDYRYFPDPDLPPVAPEGLDVEAIRRSMPELPDEKVDRFVKVYGLPRQEALLLTRDKPVSEFFETCAATGKDARRLSRWIIKDLFKLLKQAGLDIQHCPVPAADFSHLVDLVASGFITDRIGQSVLEEMFARGCGPEVIIEEKGLRPIQDLAAIDRVIGEVLAEHPDVVAKIQAGDTKPIGYLIGRVMQKTANRADPRQVKRRMEEKLRP